VKFAGNKLAPELFRLDTIFPEPEAIFSFAPRSLDAIKGDGLVVVDTNALLLPYRTDPSSLKAIESTYAELIKHGRLIVPAQVAREFASNRATLLGELNQQIEARYVGGVEGTKHYPLLGEMEEYKRLKEIEKSLNSNIEAQRKAVGALLQAVRRWNWDDPVSSLYKKLFSTGVVMVPQLEQSAVLAEFERRKAGKIPPGYKDSGAGDLLIWLTVLELAKSKKRDLIFVSGDEKADWWHRSDGALYPRYELVDEYRRSSGGRTLHIVRLGRLLEALGVDEKVVEAVRQQEAVGAIVSRPQGHWGHVAEASVYNWLSQKGGVFTEAGHLFFALPGSAKMLLEVKLLADPSIAVRKLRASMEAAARNPDMLHLVVMVAAGESRAEKCVKAMTASLPPSVGVSPNLRVLTGFIQGGAFRPGTVVWPGNGWWSVGTQ